MQNYSFLSQLVSRLFRGSKQCPTLSHRSLILSTNVVLSFLHYILSHQYFIIRWANSIVIESLSTKLLASHLPLSLFYIISPFHPLSSLTLALLSSRFAFFPSLLTQWRDNLSASYSDLLTRGTPNLFRFSDLASHSLYYHISLSMFVLRVQTIDCSNSVIWTSMFAFISSRCPLILICCTCRSSCDLLWKSICDSRCWHMSCDSVEFCFGWCRSV